MERSELKRDAKMSLKGNWGLMVGITLFMILISSVFSFFKEVADAKLSIDIIRLFWNFLVVTALSVGQMKVYLNLSEQKQARFGQIFTFFTDRYQYFRATFTQALVMLYLLLWTWLLIVPGIVKSYAYSMTPFILNDEPSLSYNQAITRSRQMMDGYKGKLFMLHLSFIGWFLLGILSFGIGFLWIGPYINASQTQFYLRLREKWQTT